MDIKKLRPLFSWLLMVLLLTGLGRYVWLHIDDFTVISRIRPLILLLLVFAYIVIMVITTLRYYVVMHSLGLAINLKDWFRIFVLGRYFNRFFPQIGTLYRIVVLKTEYNFSVTNYLAAFAAFNYLERMVSILLALLAVLIVEPKLQIAGFNAAMLLGLFFLFALLIIVTLGIIVTRSNEQTSQMSKTKRRFMGIIAAMIDCLKNPTLITLIVLPGILIFVIGISLNWLLFVELGSPLTLGKIAILLIAKNIAMMVVLTPGNVGVSEITYGLLGSAISASTSQAIIVAAVLNITNTLTLFAIGTALGGLRVMRSIKSKEITEEENAI